MTKVVVLLFIASVLLSNQGGGQCFPIIICHRPYIPQLHHHQYHRPHPSSRSGSGGRLFETKKDIEWKKKLREEEDDDEEEKDNVTVGGSGKNERGVTTSSSSGVLQRSTTATMTPTTTMTLREPFRPKADSLGRSRPAERSLDVVNNDEIAKRLHRVKEQQQQQVGRTGGRRDDVIVSSSSSSSNNDNAGVFDTTTQQNAITDPQALADYYLQHENIPRVILQANLLLGAHMPPTKNFLSDAYGHVMRILPKQQQQLVSSTIEWKRLVRHHANEFMNHQQQCLCVRD